MTNVTNATVSATTSGRGRPDIFTDKFKVVGALAAIKNGDEKVSRFLTDKLIAKGYVTQSEDVKSGRPGRPAFTFNLTPKGRTYLNFSKNWKKATN